GAGDDDKAGAVMTSNKSPESASGVDDAAASISPSTSVSDALARMERMGQRATVVMDGNRPVGVITAIALRGRGHAIHTDAQVQDLMDYEVVHVDPSFDVEDTLRRYRDAAWNSVRRR